MPKLSLQVEEELKAACSQQAEQLQEMGRRERLLSSDLQRAGEQVGNGRDVNISTGAMAAQGYSSPWGRMCCGNRNPES